MRDHKAEDAFCYYRAAGRSLAAIMAHRQAVDDAVMQIQSFVMLCGAERALGHAQVKGLLFPHDQPLPKGWKPHSTAPRMAIPDTETLRGKSFLQHMKRLIIPSEAEFSVMIGGHPLRSHLGENAPILSVVWSRYVPLSNQEWAIVSPVAKDGSYTIPPDAEPLSAEDFRQLALAEQFNRSAGEVFVSSRVFMH